MTIKEKKLLEYIYGKHGGTSAVAKKLGITKQLASLWKNQGRVPLREVRWVADTLGVPPCALNFKEVKELCKSCEDFEAVKQEVKEIFKVNYVWA